MHGSKIKNYKHEKFVVSARAVNNLLILLKTRGSSLFSHLSAGEEVSSDSYNQRVKAYQSPQAH